MSTSHVYIVCFLIDINECNDKDVCGNGVCSNTVGSFTCRCEEGYSAKLDSGPACTDEDECEMGTHRCDMNAACINNPVRKMPVKKH